MSKELSFEDDADPFGLGDSLSDQIHEISDEEALKTILAETPDDLGAIHSLAHIHRVRGEFDKAERLFRQVLSLSGGNHAAKAIAFNNLGLLSLKKGDTQKALEHYQEACNYFEMRGNEEGLAVGLCNIGNIYRKLGELESAEEFYKKSLALNIKLDRKLGIITDFTSLGQLAFGREAWDLAEEYYRKALAVEEELERKNGIAVLYANIGAIERKRGNNASAREYWEQALGMFKELGARDMSMKVQRWLDFLRN